MMHPIDFDEAVLRDRYATYAGLRATDGLVRHRTHGYYLVARYEDVREAAMRPEDFSSQLVDVLLRENRVLSWFASAARSFGPVDVLAVADGPTHKLHRKLAMHHFAREPVAETIARTRPFIDARLERFVSGGGGDFAADIASIVPIEIALQLLGFPDSDGPNLKRLADAAVELLSGILPRKHRVAVASLRAVFGLYAYSLRRLRSARRRGGSGATLTDALLEAIGDDKVSEREAASMVMQIITAGADSTANMLGNATQMLAESPELAQTLRADPSLIPAFLDECVRLESPFQGHFRVVRRSTSLAGTPLEPGDRLMLLWGSANRDPDAFADADRLDLRRRGTGKPPVAFGYGPHLCLGSGLARAVGRTVVEGFLDRTVTIELATPRATLRPSPYLRGVTALPLRVTPTQRMGRSGPSSEPARGPGFPLPHGAAP